MPRVPLLSRPAQLISRFRVFQSKHRVIAGSHKSGFGGSALLSLPCAVSVYSFAPAVIEVGDELLVRVIGTREGRVVVSISTDLLLTY